MPYAFKIGTIDEETYKRCRDKTDFTASEKERLSKIYIQPGSTSEKSLAAFGEPPLKHETALLNLLKRPGIDYASLSVFTEITETDKGKTEFLESEVKYEGYIKKQEDSIRLTKKLENTKIPEDFDYASLTGLTLEAVQKLSKMKPETLGIASRIQGVTPGDINVLIILLKKHNKNSMTL